MGSQPNQRPHPAMKPPYRDPELKCLATMQALRNVNMFMPLYHQVQELTGVASSTIPDYAVGVRAAWNLFYLSLQPTDNHINPMRLFFELEKILPDNAILVADGGDFVATGAYILRPRGALQWLDPGAFGTLGVGGGFALGAKLCRPDSEVWIIWGDGSCGYSVAEIDTMKRFGAHVISIVGNDAGWTQILREQMPTFNSSVACKLEHTNYHEVSQGYGGEGLLLKYDKDDIAGTLRRAQTIGQKSSVLLNVWIGKTSFRDGSISV